MSARSPRLPTNRPRKRRSSTSTPDHDAQPSSAGEAAPKSPAEHPVDHQFATVIKSFSAALAAQPANLKNLSEPDVLRRVLELAASVTGEQWEKMLEAIGPAGRQLVQAYLASEQWGQMLVAAGPEGRQLLWRIFEGLLSTFARRSAALAARDAYQERHRDRDPRRDSTLAIRLAAAAALARTLDGALPSLPSWAVWPLIEIDYEKSPAELYTFDQCRSAVERVLSHAVPADGAASLRHPDADLSSYLNAIRQQLATSVAASNTVVGYAIVNELSPAYRREANRQRELVFRMFYVGVRLTYEKAGYGEPTRDDVADLWLCWDLGPQESPKQVRESWRKRIKAGEQYFDGINSSRSSTSVLVT